MIRKIVFDLSEVLIAGLIGIETALAERFGRTPAEVLDAFGGDALQELLHGRLSEDEYLEAVRAVYGWDVELVELKSLIRRNFDVRVPGMEEILDSLASRFELVLLSDHGTEWVSHIREVHPFLERFSHQFFSCEIGCTKRSTAAFETVLRKLGGPPGEYLFVDDNAGNVEVARSVGMQAVRFTGATDLRVELGDFGIRA